MPTALKITVLVVPGCPNEAVCRDRIAEALAGRAVPVETIVVARAAEAERLGMHGSPTILLDGADPFARPPLAPSLSCRVYPKPGGGFDGAPSVAALRTVIDARASAPGVLFVCVRNVGRSQMAAGFIIRLAGDRIAVRSAPADAVDPVVIEAMKEVGIDIAAETPKILTVDAVRASDVCVTMGCRDACPVVPGKRYLDWQIDDSAGTGLDAVRAIRDEIGKRVRALIEDVLPAEDE
jgi:protein-tyrosine-phosphatase